VHFLQAPSELTVAARHKELLADASIMRVHRSLIVDLNGSATR
jgi:hypothetical protein